MKMFCSNCGKRISEGVKYCSYCGQVVESERSALSTSQNVVTTEESQKVNKALKPSNPLLWILPLCAFIMTIFAVGGYFAYELKVDKDINNIIATGESLVLAGDLDKAQRLFKQGLTHRPNNKTLITNLQVIEEGQHFEGLLKEAQHYFSNENYTSALALLTEVEKQATLKEGVFYEQYVQKALFQYANTTIAALDKEDPAKMSHKLDDVIKKLKNFEGEESGELQNQILKKVTDTAYNNAQKHLQLNQFTEAIKEVDKGLTYDAKNEKLLAFKDTIAQTKKSYEQAENKRIEKAMQQAAQEDLANRTEAVYLVEWDYHYDYNYNYLSLWGEVQNIGTRPISMVKVYYSVYDIYGQFIGKAEGYIYPNYLMHKEGGSFEQGHYISTEVGNVTIDYFTWYVE